MADYTFKIQRFNPDKDKKPHYEEYSIALDQTDRVLDGLNEIKWTQDGTLTYRRSCAHGVCGSDAMRINGRNRLACKVLIKEVGSNHITIEPMLGFTVIKDLVVDLEPFFEKYRSIAPYLINDSAPGETERLQSPEDRARYDDGTVHHRAACLHVLSAVLGEQGSSSTPPS
jgi:succinate dehydrogenase / fumarate reductase iron-sulfur subunit